MVTGRSKEHSAERKGKFGLLRERQRHVTEAPVNSVKFLEIELVSHWYKPRSLQHCVV